MSRLLAVAAAVLAFASLSACSGGSDGSSGAVTIDRDAWRDELVAAGDVRANPDLDVLEDVTRDMCEDDIDDLALALSLAGSRPDLVRINMKHVCPDEAHKVDEALEELQDASSAVEEACDTAPTMRTEEQSLLAEAMGC